MTNTDLLQAIRKRAAKASTRTSMSDVLRTKVFPPAEPTVLRRAERELGFELAPCYRRMLHEVGNGGYGPGYGVLGVYGGYPDDTGKTLVEKYRSIVSEYESIESRWPPLILPVADWGDGVWSCIDCSEMTGSIVTLDDDGLVKTRYGFENWMKDWAQGEDLWGRLFRRRSAAIVDPMTRKPKRIVVRGRAIGERLLSWPRAHRG